jgi:phosphoglycolate phosphatase
MAIATNKRRVPTLKILKYLGWEQYFTIVGTLDMCSPPHPDKGSLIKYLLQVMERDGKASLYVGDKREDGEAAQANGMAFVAAGWGYGEWDSAKMPIGWRFVENPAGITHE